MAVVRWVCAGLVVVALAGCGSRGERPDAARGAAYGYGPAPAARAGNVPRTVGEDGRALARSLGAGSLDGDALARLAASGDVRQAWLLADLLRFVQSEGEERALVGAFARLTGRDARRDPGFARGAWAA